MALTATNYCNNHNSPSKRGAVVIQQPRLLNGQAASICQDNHSSPHWGHRRYHANSDAPAATICRDNHSMPSWSPNPLLTSHAWMCQLLLQHSLNRPKFSVIDSMLIQLSTSWFRRITQSAKIIYLPKCLVFSIWAKVQRSTSKVTCITSISWSSTWEHLVYND